MGNWAKIGIPILAVSIVLSITIVSISAEESLVPSWIKTTTGFWCDGFSGDYEWSEVILIQNLIERGAIVIPENVGSGKKIPAWIKDSTCWWVDGLISDKEFFSGLQFLANKGYISLEKPESKFELQAFCSGITRCFAGTVTEIIDGDTIRVDGKSIRLALVDTPERGYTGYSEAKQFISNICPVGSSVIVDEDDKQTSGSFGRIISAVYCNGKNLNEAVLKAGLARISDSFCAFSEFWHTAWAQKYGCAKIISDFQSETSCDSAYPDVCIPPEPPDLNCADIPFRNFTVLPPDPHGFDGDKDGIGCES